MRKFLFILIALFILTGCTVSPPPSIKQDIIFLSKNSQTITPKDTLLSWQTEFFKDQSFSHLENSSNITLNYAGLYRTIFECSANNTGSNNEQVQWKIWNNNIELNASVSWSIHIPNSTRLSSISITNIHEFELNDTLFITAIAAGNDMITQIDTCRLIIERIR